MDIINNINISRYNAQISNKYIQPSTFENDIDWPDHFMKPQMVSRGRKFQKIEIKILFSDLNRDSIEKDISNFMASGIEECDIKFDNLSHKYHCYLVDSEKEYTDFDDWIYLNLTMYGYEYSDQVTNTLNAFVSGQVVNPGNTDTPCILEITPTSDIADITLTGFGEDITIKNLNKDTAVIIDGVNGKVTENNINKYGDTEMWEFPYLKKGNNAITSTRNNVKVVVKFNPLYV